MYINTVPPKAAVTIFDQKTKGRVFEGETPVTASLKKNDGYFDPRCYRVVIKKEGFPDYLIDLQPTVSGWYIGGNVLVGGLIGWVIADPSSGAMWNISPDSIEIDLNQSPPTNLWISTSVKEITDNGYPMRNSENQLESRKNKVPYFEIVYYKPTGGYGNHVKLEDVGVFHNFGDSISEDVSFETESGIEYRAGLMFPLASGHTQVGWMCSFTSGPNGHYIINKLSSPSGYTTRVDGIYQSKFTRLMGIARRNVSFTKNFQFHLQGAGGLGMGNMKGSWENRWSIFPSPKESKNFEGSWFGPTAEISSSFSYSVHSIVLNVGVVYDWFPEKSEDDLPYLKWHPIGLKAAVEF